jgi:hypothetical protein
VARSPRANYTDWATATSRGNLVPTFVDRGDSIQYNTKLIKKQRYSGDAKIWLKYVISRSRNLRSTAVGISCADHPTPSTGKSRDYFAGHGCRSVGIVRLRTISKGVSSFLYQLITWFWSVNEKTELFLACQHLNSRTNLSEYDDQSWFKVHAVPVFRFDSLRCIGVHPGTTAI